LPELYHPLLKVEGLEAEELGAAAFRRHRRFAASSALLVQDVRSHNSRI
jgi:hypothetical protein